MRNDVLATWFLAAVVFAADAPGDWNARMRLANALHEGRRWAEARAAYALAVEESATFGPTDGRHAQALNNYAAHLAELGEHSRAAELYQKAIQAWKANGQVENRGIATCNLGVLYRTTGRYALAASTAEEGIRTLESVTPEGSGFLATCWNNAAESYRNLGDLKKAEQAARRSAELALRTGGARDVRLAAALHTLGNICQLDGRAAESLEAYEKALAIRSEVLGEGHPMVGTTLSGMSSVLLKLGRPAEAAGRAERALAIVEKVYGPEHGQLVPALNNLAQALRAEGKHEQAEPLFRRALFVSGKRFGRDHPDHARVMANFAEYLYSLGRHSASAELYEQAGALLLAALGAGHPQVADVHVALAHVYRTMRRNTEANSLWRRWRGISSFTEAGSPLAAPVQ